MSDDTYNGWTNRETWAVALYINNDEGWQVEVIDALRAMPTDSASLAATVIRDLVESWVTVDGFTDTFGGDRLPASLSRIAEDIGSLYRVNWDELGASFLFDLGES